METYKVIVDPDAEKSLNDIFMYILNNLRSPESAENTSYALLKAINSLDFMPQRYAVLPEDFLEKEGIRRMQVRNYFVYFNVDEANKRVNILDVLYVGREQREQFESEEE